MRIYCVKPGGRQDQQGNKTIWLPSASKALDNIDQSPPRAGEGDARPQPSGATEAEGAFG